MNSPAQPVLFPTLLGGDVAWLQPSTPAVSLQTGGRFQMYGWLLSQTITRLKKHSATLSDVAQTRFTFAAARQQHAEAGTRVWQAAAFIYWLTCPERWERPPSALCLSLLIHSETWMKRSPCTAAPVVDFQHPRTVSVMKNRVCIGST